MHWDGDYLSGSGPEFGSFPRLLCEVRDTPEGNVFNYLDDLPSTKLSQLFSSIRIHLEKEVNYKSESFLPHTKQDYFSENDYLVNQLGLEPNSKELNQLLSSIKQLIIFNNQITNWKSNNIKITEEKNYFEYQPTKHNRKLIFNGINEILQLQERIIEIFKSWEYESQNNWYRIAERKFLLKNEKKKFWNHERLYFLIISQSLPLPFQMKKIICSFLPPTLYGTTTFGAQTYKTGKWRW
jgi:hypothetical protein